MIIVTADERRICRKECFKTIDPDNGNIGVLLRKSFARIGQCNDEIDERTK